MIRTTAFFFSLITFLPALIHAQVIPYNVVIRNSQPSFQGPHVKHTIRTGNGNFIMGGTWQDQLGMLICSDSASNILWSKTYSGGAAPAVFPDMSIDYLLTVSDSTFLVTGTVVDPNAGANPYCGLVMMADTAGNVVWAKKLFVPGQYVQLAYSEKTLDGGFVFTGTSGNPVQTAPYQFFVLKTDSAGNTEWAKLYSGGNHANSGRVIHQLTDSGFILTGFMESLNPLAGSAAVIHLSATGTVMNAVQIQDSVSTGGNPLLINGCDLSALYDGASYDGCIVYTNCPSGGGLGIVRTDTAGHILWQKMYQGFSSGGGNSIYPGNRMQVCNDGSLLFTGTNGFSGSLFKTDSTGNIVWSATTDMILYDAINCPNGEIHMVGAGPLLGVINQPEAGSLYEVGIIHTEETSLTGLCIYPSSVQQMPATCHSSLFFSQETMSGTTQSFTPITGTCTLQASTGCVDILGGFSETAADPEELEISPNPCNNIAGFKFKNAGGRLIVSNTIGEKIFDWTIKENSISLDLQNQPAGVLNVVYLSEGKIKSKKLLVLH